MKLYVYMFILAAPAFGQVPHQHHPQSSDEYAKVLEDPSRDGVAEAARGGDGAGPVPTEAVADIGAGTCYFARRFASHAAKFYAVDIDRGAAGYRRGKDTLLIFGTCSARASLWARAGRSVAIYILHNVLYAAVSYPAGAIGDRVNKKTLLAAGYAMFGVMCLLFLTNPTGIPMLALLFVLAGVYVGIVDAMERALAADLLPIEQRGVGYGALATANSFGDLLSSIIVGLLWAHVSFAALAAFGITQRRAHAVGWTRSSCCLCQRYPTHRPALTGSRASAIMNSGVGVRHNRPSGKMTPTKRSSGL